MKCRRKDCDNTALWHNLCEKHETKRYVRQVCTKEGCRNIQFSRGLCAKHYQRLIRGVDQTSEERSLELARQYYKKMGWE